MAKKITCGPEQRANTVAVVQLAELVALAMKSWSATLRLSVVCVALSLPTLGLYLLLHR
jgi:hypothetical protein